MRIVLVLVAVVFQSFSWISCGASTAQPKVLPAHPPKETPRAPKPADDGLVSLDDYTPHFSDFQGQEALQALAEDRLEDAMKGFDDIAASTSDIVITPRARLMAALVAEQLGENERALLTLPALAEELPLTADLALERAARAALGAKKYEAAIEHADGVDKDSTRAPSAAMIRADALRASGRLKEARDTYQAVLDEWPSSDRRPEAESRIVECLACLLQKAELGEDGAKEALARIERLRAQSPSGNWTVRAEAHEAAILNLLGLKKTEARPTRLLAQKAFEEALDLKRRMKNEAAEKAFLKVIKLSRKTGTLRCKARFEQAIVVARQRDFKRAAELFAGVADDCDSAHLRIRSLYRGAKAYFSADLPEDAIEMFGRVESEYPTHSFADDARLRAARCYQSLGNREKFTELLASLPDLYPSGDMRADALWLLAHDAISKGEHEKAREALVRYYALFPNEKGWRSAGRSGYWLGRVEEIIGDVEKAVSLYENVIASAPLSCYMVLAYNRLAAIRPKQAEALIRTLAPKGGNGTVRFSEAMLGDFRHLAVGLELHRLGLTDDAAKELKALLKTPNLPPEVHWIAAALQRQSGRFDEAQKTASTGDISWQSRYPTDRDLTPWTLAYPTVYEDEVLSAAKASDVSSHLIWAIMREESGFNPSIESWANAIGLMQLILPTARSMGESLGIQVNRRSLRKPEVNIPLGTAYLAHLEALFAKHPVLTIAGYNAGEGAVSRWLNEIGTKDIDVFIEQIPYEQTRGYTKRVLGTYAAYQFLYGDERKILELPLTLPIPEG
jgi:soluble lytic murein transglycosylase